jgi:hypothetical protein
MQSRKLLSIIAIAAFVATMYSCKKGEVISDVESLGKGAYVTLVKLTNTIIDYGNLSTSSVSATVKEFGKPLEKIVLYVTKGTASFDRTKWKKIKEVPYSGETELKATATEIATALGIPVTSLETGATYTLYNQCVTKDGEIHDAANTNGGYQGITNYNMLLTWSAVVVCPFNPAGFAGNFVVLEDGWADYGPGDIVTVDATTANSLTMTVYPNPAFGTNRKSIKVDIVPATGKASVASQVYGDYPGFDSNLKVATVGNNNWVFTCVGTITLRLSHIGAANWGDYALRLRKQ